MQRAFTQGAENGRWRAAWAEIKLQALLRQPDKIESLLTQYGEIAERFPRGRVEVRLAKMLLAALRREGNAMEAPYAEVRHLIRQSLIPADLMEEIPIWRAMALIYRGQFQAALEKFDEIRASVSAEGVARVPTLYRLLADAYSAHCYQRLGQSKEATPLRESARQLAPKKSKLAILKLGPKARLEAKKKEDFSQSRQDAKKKERKEGSKG
jgi:tetratricopeptide (TPR) repeat protein